MPKDNDKPDQPEKRQVTIIVNGREKPMSHKEELSFEEVVDLAFDEPPTGPDVMFTITYRRGHGDKPEGSMVEGGPSVRVHDGMIFNVKDTTRS